MAHYTTEIRSICETLAGLSHPAGYGQVTPILEKAAPKIFDFDYPIFDADYSNPLEIKILRHFYTREIGMETYGLWKLRLEAKMNEIMPYYNQLYKSTLYEAVPYNDVDLTKTYTKNIDGTQTQDSSGHSNSTQNTDINQTTENSETTNENSNSTNRENTINNANTNTTDTKHGTTETETTGVQQTAGGDTVTTTKNGTVDTDGNSTATKTRNLTDETIVHGTTDNDTTVTTNTTQTSEGDSNSSGTNQLSGTDTTTDSGKGTSSGSVENNWTENRDNTNNSNKNTTTLNKLLDTPQDNVQLLVDGTYLTSAGHSTVEESVTGSSEDNITHKGEEISSSATTTDNTRDVEYGRKETIKNDSSFSQTDTGNGTQKTSGGVTTDNKSTTTGTGTEKTDTNATENKTSTESGKSVTDSNRKITTTENVNATEDSTNSINTNSNSTSESNSNQNVRGTSNVEGRSTTTGGNTVTSNSNSTANSNSKIRNLEQYVEHIAGRNGGRSYATTLMELRKTFLNIDMQIINELEELFMQIW